MPLLLLALAGSQIVLARAGRRDFQHLTRRATLSATISGTTGTIDRVPLPRLPRHEFQPRGRFTPPARAVAAPAEIPRADLAPYRVARPPRVDPRPMFHPPRAS